jgi:hypothetical protein
MDALNKKLDRHRNVTRQMKSLIFVPLTFLLLCLNAWLIHLNL